jgi:pSer/pThr/pTyr-binding forkhead associated (FHA) protein
MPKMIVSIDGVVIKEVQLTKDRTTLGRRPYNDIVIDNLAVSGEHAVLLMTGNEVYLEDLNSTNGTYVNGKAVKKQLLQNADTVEIGKYKIKYINEAANPGYEKTMIIKAGSIPTPPARPEGATTAPEIASVAAAIKVLSGPAARSPWSRWSPPSASLASPWRQSPSARMVSWSPTWKVRTSRR